MFSRAKKFNQDISSWDVSKVENMNDMFMERSFNQNLSKWSLNTNGVTVNTMFSSADDMTFHNIGTPAISNNKLVFKPSIKTLLETAVDAWISNLSTATTNYGDINTWDVSLITDMSELFSSTRNSGVSSFNSDISSWNVSE